MTDIRDEGGVITEEDLLSYELSSSDALYFDQSSFRIFVAQPPSSGVIFAFIFNIMAAFKRKGELDIEDTVDFHHKLIEAFKVRF